MCSRQWRIYKYPRGRSRVARELSQKSNDDDLALVLAKEIEGDDDDVHEVFVISGLVADVLTERIDPLSDLKKTVASEVADFCNKFLRINRANKTLLIFIYVFYFCLLPPSISNVKQSCSIYKVADIFNLLQSVSRT